MSMLLFSTEMTLQIHILNDHPSDMRVPPTFFIRDFSLDMPSSSNLLSVVGIIFLENVWRLCQCGVPLSKCSSLAHTHTDDCPIRSVVTRSFRKRGSSTRDLHQHCLLHTDPQRCLHVLQPPSGSVFSMYPLLQARTSYHIAS